MAKETDNYNIYKSKPEDCLNYWRNPSERNNPERYKKHSKRSQFLVDFFKENNIPLNASIMELGCNVGRNLNFLFNAGYKNLNGIDINPNAIKLMKEYYPNLKAKTRVGELEKVLVRDKKGYDVIFTMAVLHHIHQNNIWIFEHIARLADKLVIIEYKGDKKRNYKNIFENYGFTILKQVTDENKVGIKGYSCILLEKIDHHEAKTEESEQQYEKGKDDITFEELKNNFMKSNYEDGVFSDTNLDDSEQKCDD